MGMVSTPLLALYMPPLQAAALLLPILFVQDAISVWTYRHHWDTWNVKVMLTGAVLGVAIAWALASYVADAAVRLLVGSDRRRVRAQRLVRRPADHGEATYPLRPACSGAPPPASPRPGAGGRAAVPGVRAAAAIAQVHPGRHQCGAVRGDQRAQARALHRARPVLGQGPRHVGGADPARRRHELSGHLAGADHADAGVLSDCLCAGVSDLIGVDLAGRGGLLAG